MSQQPKSVLTPQSSFTFAGSSGEKSNAQSHRTSLSSADNASHIVEEPKPAPAPAPAPPMNPILAAMQKPKDPNQVSWDGPDDPENPQNWSQGYKWWLTVATMIMCINVTFASSAPTSAVLLLKQQFHTSREVADLITSVFLLGYCIGPLFWGPGSELMGRRPVFLIAMFSYTVLILGQSLAPNVETLLVTRFLSGFFACAPVNNSGGVIADIWGAETRGLAVSLIAASVFLGPVLGPIISGFIVDSHLSWRWVFWVMMIFAGVCSLITTPFFPETYGPILLHRKAERLRREEPEKHTKLFSEHEKQDWTFGGVIRRTILRPFIMLMLEPILSLITIYLSMVYGVLYALFSAFPIIFVGVRGFSISQNGLIFIGVGIGTIVGSLINVWTSRGYNELIKKWKGFPPPEERLYSAMIGAPALVVGAFWLGWTGHYASVPWYVPAISTILIGAGINLVFMSFLTYLVDTYLIFSASAMAANTVIRSAVAAGFPLFTIHMFTRLGINWACTLIALLALFFVPAPFLFYKYGPLIRTKSKFAPCVDLAIAAKMKEAAEAAKKQGGLNV